MAQIILPHHLRNGTAADASQVMANFNAIVNVVNGNLGSDNLRSISGTDVIVNDINGGTSHLNNFTRRFQSGYVTFSNVPGNEYVTREIKFPKAFPGEPYITLGKRAATPDRVIISYYNSSKSGFSLAVKNTGETAYSFSVSWLAIYTGAFS